MQAKSNDSPELLFSRFKGKSGRQRLIGQLISCTLVKGDKSLAAVIAKKARLILCEKGELLINQGDSDSDIYIILSGTLNVHVNGRPVATRGRGDHVGEMAAIDPTLTRTSRVTADQKTLLAKLQCNDFEKIAEDYTVIWRNIAGELSNRLTERNLFHKEPRSEPVVFFASSSEGKPALDIVCDKLPQSGLLKRMWHCDVFRPGNTVIEDLEVELSSVDFSVIFLTADDRVKSRGVTKRAPRDNLLLEIGLSMGKLGRKRTLIVCPEGDKLKLPSDLKGLNYIQYNSEPKRLNIRIAKRISSKIHEIIKTLGPI